MRFLEQPTRNLLFTGKGGVGKTSLACASAVRLAEAGKRVLLVSTDPASNLDEVLEASLANEPTAVPAVAGLWAMNIDPQAAAAAYRERMVAPYRGMLPAEALTSIEEQFSGSCTLEIAAFDEFSRLLGDANASAEFDHVIFDTAPTGHTLRLLTLPSAWSVFMESNTTGTTCLGPLAGLEGQRRLYQETVRALSDRAITTLILVARPEMTALAEAARTSSELAELGVENQHLVVNGVFHALDRRDSLATAMELRGRQAIADMPDLLRQLPPTEVPLAMNGMMGIEALRTLGQSPSLAASVDATDVDQISALSLSDLMDDLAAPGHGVILAMGKGGVGKTTVAAAIAVALADRGFPVHLSTTDPAAHLTATVHGEEASNLTVSRIDPSAETLRYTEEVMRTAGAGLDEAGRALLAEDLRSPCTEEIAVFRAFAEAVADAEDRFVVLDTAPTGHTILLLDAALAYHREVARQSSQTPDSVKNLLPRLRDPEFTRVLLVTLPEATPVHEAAELRQDLRRAGINPYAWIINQSLASLPIADPVLRGRQANESKYIHEVTVLEARQPAIIAWQPEAPRGYQALRRLVVATPHATRASA